MIELNEPDGEYQSAARKLDRLAFPTKNVQKGIQDFQDALSDLSDAMSKLGNDVQQIMEIAPDDMPFKAETFRYVMDRFRFGMINFFTPILVNRVKTPLTEYDIAFEGVQSHKEEREKLFAKTQTLRDKANKAIAKADDTKAKKYQEDFFETFTQFKIANGEFVARVATLKEQNKMWISGSFERLISLISRCSLMFFTEVQKLRTISS